MNLNFKTNCSVHNRFDIVVRDAETEEVIQRAQAENIVLDRIYTRLCTFNTFFTNIVFGRGTGTLAPTRTTLFNRIGSRAAVDEQLIRSYPLSIWTRRIRLETTEFNGETITEVAISDDATQINTHALITDAEGNPISLPKTSLRIIDIYATVYAIVYNVDHGLMFDGDGLRNYLTGAAVAADQLGIGFAGNFDDYVYLSSARTSLTAEKAVQTFVRFNVQHFNKDIRFIRWSSVGLRCEIPRTGVFADYERTNVVLGAGNGVNTTFTLPNKNTKDHTLYVNGIQNDDWEFDSLGRVVFDVPPGAVEGEAVGTGDDTETTFTLDNIPISGSATIYIDGTPVDPEDYTLTGDEIVFDTAPADGAVITADYKYSESIPVTADYTCNYVPKDIDHVFDVTMKIVFGGAEPTPVMPSPDYTNVPGATTPVGGTATYGFFGEVTAANLINGADLSSLIGMTAGTLQHSAEPWLKFALNGRILFVHKKTIRHTVSWNHINTAGAVFGDKIITLNGVRYAVRLLSSAEWNALMYPVHVDYGQWHQYTNADLLVHHTHGNGSYSWTSTPSGSSRLIRGSDGVAYSRARTPSDSDSSYGFRPVLEVL